MTDFSRDPIGALRGRGFGRRRFLSLAGLGAGSLALAACGGPETAPSATSRGATGSAAVPDSASAADWAGITPASKITFWSNHPGSSEAVEKEIIAAFNASGQGITVELVTAGANYEEVAQKFQTAQAGGTLPDLVIFSDVWWFRYYLQKSIIPMDGIVEAAGIDRASYRQGLWNDYQYSGQQWAVPYARSTPLFYYNKTHWAAAGLEDRAPNTWSEFAGWAPKLQAAGTGVQHAFQHPALADYAGWVFQNNLWGENGGWSAKNSFDLTTDSAETIQALQFLQDSVYSGQWAGVSSKSATDDLAAGAVSATLASTGSLVGVQKAAAGKFEIGVGFLPGGSKTTDFVCPTGGAGLGIPADIPKENQLAAAKFLAFLTNAENSVKFSAATGYMPVREDADTTALVTANPLAKTAIDQLAHTRPQDYARVFLPGADQEMAKAAAAILTQQQPVQNTMRTLKTTLQTIYDKQVAPHL